MTRKQPELPPAAQKLPLGELPDETQPKAKALAFDVLVFGLIAGAVFAIPELSEEASGRFFGRGLQGFLIFSLVGWLFAGGLYLWGSFVRRRIQPMAEGDYIVTWQCDPERWREIGPGSRDHRTHSSPSKLEFAMGILILGFVLAAVATPLRNNEGFGLIGTVLAFPLVAGQLVLATRRRFARIRSRIQESTGYRCVVGRQGLYAAGAYWPWGVWGHNLNRVGRHDEYPDAFLFEFEQSKESGVSTKDVVIPVPPKDHPARQELKQWARSVRKGQLSM